MNFSSKLSSSQFKSKSQSLNRSNANDEVIICPFSNLRIIRPLVDLETFKSKMIDKKMVKLNNIRQIMNKKSNDIDGDWTTIGVIADKLPIRKTKKGTDYSIWKLNDLQNLDKSIILMLFGDAHETQWKLTKGSVIALLNCKILPNKDLKSDLTLSIEKGSKLMHLGSSKDLGNCRAPKNNGDMCNALINTSNGNYCVFHVKAGMFKINLKLFLSINKRLIIISDLDYAKLSSMRPELQAAMNGFGVDNKFSNGRNMQTFSSFRSDNKIEDSKLNKDKKEDLMNKYQSRKAQEADTLFKQLKNDSSLSARNLVHYQKTISSTNSKETPYEQAKKLLFETNQKETKPILGRGLKPGDIFDIGKKVNPTELAKQRAIQMMKNRMIEKQDPNKVFSNKKTKFELSNILNKVESNLNDGEEILNSVDSKKKDIFLNSEIIERKRRRAQEEVEMKKRKLEAIDAIMNRKSAHEEEVREQEIEAENKYFNLMEKKEKIEEQMSTVFQTDCNVTICKVCNYIDHKQSDFCLNKKHLVISKKVIKRFFRCKQCKQRTHTFAQIYPIKRCKCGSDQFEKCSMYNVKEGPKLDNEKLLVRGEEVKFLNSLK